MKQTAFKRIVLATAVAVAAVVSCVAERAQAFTFGDGDIVVAIYGNATEALVDLGNYNSLLTNPSHTFNLSSQLAAAQVGTNAVKYTVFGVDSATGNGRVFAGTAFDPSSIHGNFDLNNQFNNTFAFTVQPFTGDTIAATAPQSFTSNLNTAGAGSFDGAWPVAMQGTVGQLLNILAGDSVTNAFSQVGRVLLASDGTLTVGNPGPAAVPLPAGVVLFGTGLIGLVGFARRSFNRMTA
jgi:hypothetical protein